MYVSEIIRRVRSAIDELTQDGTDFEYTTEDSDNLTQIIVDKIGYALQHVLLNAPLEKLDSDSFADMTTAMASGGSFSLVTIGSSDLMGQLILPTDLLRIIEARLSSWMHYPIPEPATSQVYLMQLDQYARGSWDRPANIMTFKNGSKVLEMYCAKESSDTLVFTYLQKPVIADIDEDEYDTTDIPVPTKLEASMIYQIAGMTMTAFREDVAKEMFAIAERYLYDGVDAGRVGNVG